MQGPVGVTVVLAVVLVMVRVERTLPLAGGCPFKLWHGEIELRREGGLFLWIGGQVTWCVALNRGGARAVWIQLTGARVQLSRRLRICGA